jgi:hypothetical protein
LRGDKAQIVFVNSLKKAFIRQLFAKGYISNFFWEWSSEKVVDRKLFARV